MYSRWRATYSSEGVPDLVIQGEELCELEGYRIRRLTDHIDENSVAATLAWIGEHGAQIGMTGT